MRVFEVLFEGESTRFGPRNAEKFSERHSEVLVRPFKIFGLDGYISEKAPNISFQQCYAPQTKILDGRTSRLESIFEALFNDKSDVPEIDQNKFLVPADLSVGQFVYVIRKRISLAQKRRSTSS